MFELLLTLLILDGLVLMVIVLLQSGKGGGLAAMGGGMGTDNFIGGRQAATLLTKATWFAGGIFLFLSLMLSVVSSSRQAQPDSVLQEEFQQTAPAQPEPVLPGADPSAPEGATPGGAAGEQPSQLPPGVEPVEPSSGSQPE